VDIDLAYVPVEDRETSLTDDRPGIEVIAMDIE
jgi:hypothetical protein